MSACFSKLGLILLGKTGAGKSAFGNFLLRKKAFKPGSDASSVSQKAKPAISNWGNIQVTVVDTPGLYSDDLSMISTAVTIQDSIAEVRHAFFVFLLVIRIGRFTSEDSDTIKLLKIMFGPNVLQHTIIIFTHEDQAARDGQNIQNFIENFVSNPKRKELFEECSKNYLSVDSYENNGNMNESKWSVLLQMVMSITQNGKKFYSEDVQIYKQVLLEYAEIWTNNRLTAEQTQTIMSQQIRDNHKRIEELEREDKEKDTKIQELQKKAERADDLILGAKVVGGVVLATAGVAALTIGAPLLAIKGATAIGSAIAAKSAGIAVAGAAKAAYATVIVGGAAGLGGYAVGKRRR